MKRLIGLIVLGVVAIHLARRVERPRYHEHRHPAPVLAAFDDGPRSVFDGDDRPAPPPPPKAARKSALKSKPTPPAQVVVPAPDPKRQPEWFPRDRDEEEARARTPDSHGRRVIVGPLSATEEKAKNELRLKVGREVTAWLGPDLRWKQSPAPYIDDLIVGTYVLPVAESLGDSSKDLDDIYTLYRAGALIDFSPARRAQLIEIHDRLIVGDRVLQGGAVTAFVLVVLAALAGYIRVDESTRGYYTNRLRMLAAAGVGAAGVVIYKMLAR